MELTRNAPTVVSAQDFEKKGKTKELYRLQAEIAMYMEVGYLSASNFPKLAGEIRLSAHDSRTIHTMTEGLMKKYYGSSVHIIETIIPLIIDAIELEDGELMREALAQIVDLATDMKKEAEDTQKRYFEVQTGVNKNMTAVSVTQGEEDKRALERQNEIQKQLDIQHELEDENKKKKDDVKQLEETISRVGGRIERGAESKAAANKSLVQSGIELLANGLLLPVSLLGGPVGFVLQAGQTLAAGARVVQSVGKIYTEMETVELDKNKKAKAEEDLKKAEEDFKLKRREELEMVRKIKELSLAETAESAGNIESLQKALFALNHVDRQLRTIVVFWQDVIVVVNHVSLQTKTGSLFTKEIKDKRYVQRFLKQFGEARKSWEIFQRIVADYLTVGDRIPQFAVDNLYGFLSMPVDRMSKENKTQRVNELFDAIERNISAITMS